MNIEKTVSLLKQLAQELQCTPDDIINSLVGMEISDEEAYDLRVAL